MKHTLPISKQSTWLGNKFKASILRLGVFLASMLLSNGLLAQITYSQDFTATTHGWTNGTRSSTTAPCVSGNFNYLRNVYSASTQANLISPSIGASNGGVVTVTYDYKI